MTSVSQLASSKAEYVGRQTPWSNEAEQAVLGAMMLDQDAALKAAEILDDTMFYKESHRLLFRSMIALTERGDVIDPVTLQGELSRRGDLDRAGGMEYIAALIDVVPTSANIDYHAKIVRDKAVLRRLVEASTGIIQDVYEGHGTAGEVLDNAEHRIFQVAQFRRAEEFIRIKELIWPTMERIEQLQSGAGSVTGVPSGFVDLDRLTAGFQRSDLVILAARPSMGKSALVTNIAENVALNKDNPRPVALFSLEMSEAELAQRFIASQAAIKGDDLRKGRLKDESKWKRVLRVAAEYDAAPLYVDDSSDIGILDVRAKARRLHQQTPDGLGLVIVDYLQLMRADARIENRVQQVGEMSRGLKILARELNVPVIALSQLSRGVESRTDKRPLLSDLRESGQIEQDADLVVFIYRDEYYNEETERPGEADLIIAKHRNGGLGDVPLTFQNEYPRFLGLQRAA